MVRQNTVKHCIVNKEDHYGDDQGFDISPKYAKKDKERFREALSSNDQSNQEAITLQLSRLSSEWHGQRARLEAFE